MTFYQAYSENSAREMRFFRLRRAVKKTVGLSSVSRDSSRNGITFGPTVRTRTLSSGLSEAAHERQAGSPRSGTLVRAAIVLPRHPSNSSPPLSPRPPRFLSFSSSVGQHNASRGISRVYKVNPFIVAQQSMLERER